MEDWRSLLPETIRDKYEFYNINHAAEILSLAHRAEFGELVATLEDFSITVDDLTVQGGNESPIPKRLSASLRPLGWQEVRISGDLVVKLHRRGPTSDVEELTIPGYIDGHNIDYVKKRVAVDMEWNSKDQTFDRDLYAFRTFYECGVISCGVIITRSEGLNPVFADLGIRGKYGASTTWMGKLLPRIHSGRHGGCPILVVGILPASIADYRPREAPYEALSLFDEGGSQ